MKHRSLFVLLSLFGVLALVGASVGLWHTGKRPSTHGNTDAHQESGDRSTEPRETPVVALDGRKPVSLSQVTPQLAIDLSLGMSEPETRRRYPRLFMTPAWRTEDGVEESYVVANRDLESQWGLLLIVSEGRIVCWSVSGPGDKWAESKEESLQRLSAFVQRIVGLMGSGYEMLIDKPTATSPDEYVNLVWQADGDQVVCKFLAPWSFARWTPRPRAYHLHVYRKTSRLGTALALLSDDSHVVVDDEVLRRSARAWVESLPPPQDSGDDVSTDTHDANEEHLENSVLQEPLQRGN